jgi:hypothetical protein
MAKGRWITPDSTGDSNVARCLSVPVKLQPAVNWALDQLTFADNWEQIGTLTPQECADAFVDVLSAYYASEDCTTMETPNHAFALWRELDELAGNDLLLGIFASQELNGAWRQSTPAINDQMQWEVMLSEGTYDLTVYGLKNNASGIQHWILDGAEDAQTIDLYAASQTLNQMITISVVVVGSGLHTIVCKMSSKNASSSNYQNNMTWVKMIRTGD